MVFNHSHDPRSLSSAVEAQAVAEKMLGSNLITKQTTEEGQPCGKVLFKLTNDFFFSFLLLRLSGADGGASLLTKRALSEYFAGPGNWGANDGGKHGRWDGY